MKIESYNSPWQVIKQENHILILMDAERKAFSKFHHLCIIKTLSGLEIEGNSIIWWRDSAYNSSNNRNKHVHSKCKNGEMLQALLLGRKQDVHYHDISTALSVPASSVRQVSEIKSVRVRKGRNKTYCSQTTWFHVHKLWKDLQVKYQN